MIQPYSPYSASTGTRAAILAAIKQRVDPFARVDTIAPCFQLLTIMMTIIIVNGNRLTQGSGVQMRISKEQVARNRERVIGAASRLFRAKGFDAVAVSDLMKIAGFTHGGFYNHFSSKEALAAEAVQRAWTEMATERTRARDLKQLLEHYLSRAARDAPGKTCPAAALASDVGRQPADVRTVFAAGLEGMIRSIEERLPDGDGTSERERAINLVTRMVGALILSRAVPDDAPLSDEILKATLRGATRDLSTRRSHSAGLGK